MAELHVRIVGDFQMFHTFVSERELSAEETLNPKFLHFCLNSEVGIRYFRQLRSSMF